jgi:hypothetical protein
MKLAVLSESPADEAAIRILVDAVLGQASEPVDLDRFRYRGGWQGALKVLPNVVRHLHYHTDADGLVVSLDSDYSPVHHLSHEQLGQAVVDCRGCQVREQLSATLNHLKPRTWAAPLQVAVGLAVPQIEAWYRCGLDPAATEAAWLAGQSSGKYPFNSLGLKRDVYGTDRPSLKQETDRATEEARRLARDIQQLETWFRQGFGALAATIRGWTSA